MQVVVLVLSIVGGIIALQLLIWIPIIIWLRKRSAAAREELGTAVMGETVICPIQSAQYEGATASGYPMVVNRGQIVLTAKRLVFLSVTEKQIIVERSAITGARQSHKFRGSARAGRPRLILQVPGGEVGFTVQDADAWVDVLTQRPIAS